MRKIALSVLYGLCLLLTGMGNSFAQVPQVCTTPYTWNSTVRKCQVAPICVSGKTYNQTTDRCEQAASPQYTCPTSGGKASTLAACNTNCKKTGTCSAVTLSNSTYCYYHLTSYWDDYAFEPSGCYNASWAAITCPSPLTSICPTNVSGWTKTSMIVEWQSYQVPSRCDDPTYDDGYGGTHDCGWNDDTIFTKTTSSTAYKCSLTGTQYSTTAACGSACTAAQSCTGPTYACSSGSLTGTTCYQAAACPETGILNGARDQCETSGSAGSYYEYDAIGRIKKIIQN